MLKRNLNTPLINALGDTPVVLLNGARQTGKTTLTQDIPNRQAEYFNFDDPTILAAALSDPVSFIKSLPSSVILDEVQHAPKIFQIIKSVVDQQRKPGRFLLTGSANVLLLPKLSESLAGRMEILTLWPLSQGELRGIEENFIDKFFTKPAAYQASTAITRKTLIESIVQGGYPEMLSREIPDRRKAWFAAYITTILQRDVRDIANIEGLVDLPRLLMLLAARSTSLLNYSELSRSFGTPQTTLKRYLTLLEITFLILHLPPWLTNHSKRLVKSPKIILNDTGLLSHLLSINTEHLLNDSQLLGRVLENFVAMELIKQCGWSKLHPKIYHFRTQAGQEVDLVLEIDDGQIIGIEVKASASISNQDFKGLLTLQEVAQKKFHCGIVLYTGEKSLAFGENLFALPVNILWERL